jgi:hypothetical protein
MTTARVTIDRTEAPAPDGLHAFAFMNGDWRVRHRKLKRRLVGETEWTQFEGTTRAWELMDGASNIDDNLLNDPAGAYRAVTFRRFDAATGLWSIWWADGRFTGIEPPVHGRFEDGVGTFLGDDTLDGRPIRVRFVWSEITPSSARWEQAFSTDAGASWEVNWVMTFERLS